MKKVIYILPLLLLFQFCLAQSFEGEIKFACYAKGKLDTTVTLYGKGKIKAGMNKDVWQYGLHEAYYDFEKNPANTWYIYNRNDNSLLLQEGDFSTYEIVKLDSSANILGNTCQVYQIFKPPHLIFNINLVQEILLVYVSNIPYEIPKGWTTLPPAYCNTNHIALKIERIILKDGIEYGRTIHEAVAISAKPNDELLLMPPKDAIIKYKWEPTSP